jgi:prepilin-type N-terminal cleavage/methylation domain-containing protein
MRARVLHAQAGFTLVELMVAMATGLVIVFAAFALVDLSVTQASRVTDRTDSTGTSQAAMERLDQELNSGCLTGDVSPIQGSTATGITPVVNSDANDLVFVTGVGDGQTGTPTEHVVSFKNGKLVDTWYANTGGSPPDAQDASTWTFSPTATGSLVLLQHVTTQSGVPMFQYYSYSNPANPTANSLVGAASISTLPLISTWPSTATNAAGSVAQVTISWVALPHDGWSDPSREATMSDSVVFRFTPASPTSANLPCD